MGVVGINSCTRPDGLKSIEEMSPEEKSVFVLSLYNNADEHYRLQFEMAPKPLTEESKKYFRGYKQVLEGSAPVIQSYVLLVNSGLRPSAEWEKEMILISISLQEFLLKQIGG